MFLGKCGFFRDFLEELLKRFFSDSGPSWEGLPQFEVFSICR